MPPRTPWIPASGLATFENHTPRRHAAQPGHNFHAGNRVVTRGPVWSRDDHEELLARFADTHSADALRLDSRRTRRPRITQRATQASIAFVQPKRAELPAFVAVTQGAPD